MKILCVIDSLCSGGAQRQMVELAKGFKERGNEVILLTYHSINFFKPELDDFEIPVINIIEPNYLKRLFKIRKEIRSQNPDAVLSFQEVANFIATFSSFPTRKWRLIVGERSANPTIKKSFKKIIFRWFHVFSDIVVSNSHANIAIVRQVAPFLKKDKCRVIYNTIDFRKWESLNTQNDSSKQFYLVIVGRYHNVKNADGLIKAISLLPENKKKQILVHWYGEKVIPEYFNHLNKLIKKFKLTQTVFLMESQQNIKQKYKEADYVGLFSHYEGFPNTICEAMAMRKPVIVTKISDLPLLLKDSKNGFFCDSYDVESIKNAIVKAMTTSTEERYKFGEANYKVAQEHFDKKKIISQYLKILS